ncbi:uncharacterized protein LOC136073129 [Hydra vulgaris]|uniref:uncharacterized protein LOC136073129 n=1 Tax=Hydra vulgaris TaxID=6087 RepID=UPI0032E9CF41
MKLLFLALVPPHLDYAAPIWNPYCQYDKDKLESVQQRASRIKILKGYSYEKRLKKLDLLLLENRRRMGDLIQMFKYLKGYDIINFYTKPEMLDNGYKTRGHNTKLRRQYIGNIKQHKFFTNRLVNDWNNLEQEAIDAVSINQFKKKLDEHFKY